MPAAPQLFKALSDPVRLRMIRAVSMAELSVAELVHVLGLPQSTVSRHLKPLRETDLLETRRDGTSVFYHRGPAFEDPVNARFLERHLENLEQASEDRATVRRVLDARRSKSREFFDRMAGQYSALTEVGGGWQALATVMAAGFHDQEVADLGAGEGELSLILARFASRVTAVDLSPRMLEIITHRAAEQGLGEQVTVAEGDLESLPLPDRSVDAAFLSQSLHHAARPEAAIAEALRICRPGGLLVLLDLVRHPHEWVREEWADQWLGFSEDDVTDWVNTSGGKVAYTGRVAGATPDLPVLLLVARRTT